MFPLNIYDPHALPLKGCREVTGQLSGDHILPCSILLVMTKPIHWKKCVLPLLQVRSTAGSKKKKTRTKIEQAFFHDEIPQR